MLVMIKSAPDTNDGGLGLNLAMHSGADLVLMQNGVYFAQKDLLKDFPGSVYVMEDDKRLRGLKDSELDKRAKVIDYDQLTDLITAGRKVVGMF